MLPLLWTLKTNHFFISPLLDAFVRHPFVPGLQVRRRAKEEKKSGGGGKSCKVRAKESKKIKIRKK